MNLRFELAIVCIWMLLFIGLGLMVVTPTDLASEKPVVTFRAARERAKPHRLLQGHRVRRKRRSRVIPGRSAASAPAVILTDRTRTGVIL